MKSDINLFNFRYAFRIRICFCVACCACMESYMEAITGSEGPQTPTVPLTLGQTESISLPSLSFPLTFHSVLDYLSHSISLLSFSLRTKLLSYEPQQKGKVKTLSIFFIGNKNPNHILIHITHFQFAQTSPENTGAN